MFNQAWSDVALNSLVAELFLDTTLQDLESLILFPTSTDFHPWT